MHKIRFRFFLSLILLVFPAGLRAEASSPLLSAPKVAARKGQPDVLVGAKRTGRFKGSNLYQKRATARQILSVPFKLSPVTSYFKVQNDTPRINVPVYSLFVVKGTGSNRNFGVSYFNARGRNITSSVKRGRQVLNIAAGNETAIKQRIKASRRLPAVSDARFDLSARNRDSRLSDAAAVKILRR